MVYISIYLLVLTEVEEVVKVFKLGAWVHECMGDRQRVMCNYVALFSLMQYIVLTHAVHCSHSCRMLFSLMLCCGYSCCIM